MRNFRVVFKPVSGFWWADILWVVLCLGVGVAIGLYLQ